MRIPAGLVASLACTLMTAAVHADPLATALADAASPIRVVGGKLDGKGADVLRPAIDAAQFVMVGEDHGIAQIPAFAGALCRELGPHGFHHLALEVGPSVAPELERDARAPDGLARAKAFDAAHPETVAFFNWREEVELLRACASATGATPLSIWGLDQELMGATGFVLAQILATHPGPTAQAAVEALVAEAAIDRATAAKTGDYSKLVMMAAAPATLDRAAAALAKDGSPEARALFASLLESRAIYQGQGGPDPYASNRRRARLMKGAFLDDLSVAAKAEGALPKVLLKFGAWHLYRGLNPLHSAELGNLIGEAAEGHRVEAVNIAVLGVHGKQLAAAGVARPFAPIALDLASDHQWKFLAPVLAVVSKTGWTLVDLRALRPRWQELGVTDPELERLVFGYDFLVVIPDPQPEHSL